MALTKSFIAVVLFGLVATCISSVIIDNHVQEEEHAIDKRSSLVTDLILAGDGTVCVYVVKFCYTLSKYPMSMLVKYLKNNLVDSIGKRDIDEVLHEVLHKRDRRGLTDMFTKIVTHSASGMACKSIVKFFRAYYANDLFAKLITFVASAMLGKNALRCRRRSLERIHGARRVPRGVAACPRECDHV